ncbi:MAG: GNAT family N-acetyltransferase [Caldilineaceae bacterium]
MVTLLPFEPKLHGGLLEQWLNCAHVRESWGDPAANLAGIVALTPPAGGALIAADDVLVGFVQWQPMAARELLESGVEAPDDQTVDIDIFIGEADYLGQGIGPAALELLLKQIKEEAQQSGQHCLQVRRMSTFPSLTPRLAFR